MTFLWFSCAYLSLRNLVDPSKKSWRSWFLIVFLSVSFIFLQPRLVEDFVLTVFWGLSYVYLSPCFVLVCSYDFLIKFSHHTEHTSWENLCWKFVIKIWSFSLYSFESKTFDINQQEITKKVIRFKPEKWEEINKKHIRYGNRNRMRK